MVYPLRNKSVISDNEGGFVLVAVLLIMVILVIIGVAGVNTSTTEVQIASNDQFHKIAFYNADSGIFVTPKLIGEAINSDADPTAAFAPGITIYGADGDTALGDAGYTTNRFYNEIYGFVEDALASDRDLQFSSGGFPVDVDIVHDGTHNIVGGGAEFASGSAGVGVGSAGGVEIRYIFTSDGTGPRNSLARIAAGYRKIPGTAGGL
jgi:hypothetical protein